ncbi:MAG: NAD(P)-dependent glycerol-3-phosphate dehydrogenase [Candidatus Obscuribacterales bacterium]|nr:NAD(P)-dependent glycerol-3-phosphate dehydrogenase [Candidatus Obscuribacterales bacterium]
MTGQAEGNAARIAVLGAGSWGATLARVLALAGKDVRLWTHQESKARVLQETRHIDKPLKMDLPQSILVSSDLEKCLKDRDLILFVCTSQSMRTVAEQVKTQLKSLTAVKAGRASQAKSELPVLLSAAKGLELESFSRMSQILEEVMPEFPVAALSGPNLALEILKGLPTASVIACKSDSVAKYAQTALTIPTLRMYSNTDIIGVELGGSFKNVIAIAAGGLDGMSLGTNAKAALITRGLAEMTRMATSLGARANTMAGLAGLGDLMATCSSELSRNYRLGKMIARGSSPEDAIAELGAVAEGVNTASALCQMAAKMKIELPIAMQVEAALKGDLSPQKAIMNLMTRPLVSE